MVCLRHVGSDIKVLRSKVIMDIPIFKNCTWIDEKGVSHKIPDTPTTPEQDKAHEAMWKARKGRHLYLVKK